MELRVGKPRYGGCFVTEAGVLPYVLPGEWVAVDGEQRPLAVIEPSPQRVEPACVHFGACGGCQYQHGQYTAQLEWKRAILQDLLASAGLGASLGELPGIATHAAEPWGYRNRIRLRVRSAANSFEVGYSRRGTNEFLPIRMCPIAAPLLWRAAEILNTLRADNVAARWLGLCTEVELFTSPAEDKLQLQLLLREPPAVGQEGFSRFCELLRAQLPELAGAGAMLDPELDRRQRRRWEGAAWGAAGIAYPAAGRSYWISRGAFFQVNRFLIDRLIKLVCGSETGALAWDLFAGVGLFTRELVERFDRVIAVEGGAAAAADLALAGRAGKGGRGGARGFAMVHGATLSFLQAQERQRERPDLVVLDPPRAGLGEEGARLLARIGAAQVRYVSCDPVTLTRDLAVLVRGGYRVEQIDLVDLFPQTYHLETVVRLVRR